MNLADVMDALTVPLSDVSGLRVVGYPSDDINPPAAIVGWPQGITFDESYGRGLDTMTLPLVLLVAKSVDRTARDALAAYCDGSGAKSIKATLEAASYTAFDTVRVTSVEFDTYTVGGIEYIAAVFSCEITGSGA